MFQVGEVHASQAGKFITAAFASGIFIAMVIQCMSCKRWQQPLSQPQQRVQRKTAQNRQHVGSRLAPPVREQAPPAADRSEDLDRPAPLGSSGRSEEVLVQAAEVKKPEPPARMWRRQNGPEPVAFKPCDGCSNSDGPASEEPTWRLAPKAERAHNTQPCAGDPSVPWLAGGESRFGSP